MDAALRAKLERQVYRKTHRDFKGTWEGRPSILVLRDGGTTIVTMDQLTEVELMDRARLFKLV